MLLKIKAKIKYMITLFFHVLNMTTHQKLGDYLWIISMCAIKWIFSYWNVPSSAFFSTDITMFLRWKKFKTYCLLLISIPSSRNRWGQISIQKKNQISKSHKILNLILILSDLTISSENHRRIVTAETFKYSIVQEFS